MFEVLPDEDDVGRSATDGLGDIFLAICDKFLTNPAGFSGLAAAVT